MWCCLWKWNSKNTMQNYHNMILGEKTKYVTIYIDIYDPNFILKWHIHARLEDNTAKCYYLMGQEQDWEISIFSFKVSSFFSNFLHEHVLHLKPDNCHPKIWGHCRNEAKTMKIFYGLWVTPHPVPRSSLSWRYIQPPDSNLPPQRVHEGGRRKEKREGERERTR